MKTLWWLVAEWGLSAFAPPQISRQDTLMFPQDLALMHNALCIPALNFALSLSSRILILSF